MAPLRSRMVPPGVPPLKYEAQAPPSSASLTRYTESPRQAGAAISRAAVARRFTFSCSGLLVVRLVVIFFVFVLITPLRRSVPAHDEAGVAPCVRRLDEGRQHPAGNRRSSATLRQNGNVTPVKGSISSGPKTFRPIWTIIMPGCRAQPAMT